jgi:G3E family GTPase
MTHKLPVTVRSGFLEGGKATLINHSLNNRDGMCVAEQELIMEVLCHYQ